LFPHPDLVMTPIRDSQPALVAETDRQRLLSPNRRDRRATRPIREPDLVAPTPCVRSERGG
jgi:hypothetical protein